MAKKMGFKHLLFVAIGFVLPSTLLAAPHSKVYQVHPGKVLSAIQSGVIIGGRSNDEFSLLNVKLTKTKKGERIYFVYGDRFGKPLIGPTGFFHMNLDQSGHRLVLDLAQLNRTAVDPEQLKAIMKSSSLVLASDMTMDPQDGSTNVVLQFKESIDLSAAVHQKKSSQIVLELIPRGDKK